MAFVLMRLYCKGHYLCRPLGTLSKHLAVLWIDARQMIYLHFPFCSFECLEKCQFEGDSLSVYGLGKDKSVAFHRLEVAFEFTCVITCWKYLFLLLISLKQICHIFMINLSWKKCRMYLEVTFFCLVGMKDTWCEFCVFFFLFLKTVADWFMYLSL